MKIIDELKALKCSDEFREFNCTLIPNVDANSVIGVKIPVIRQYAKSLGKTRADEVACFLQNLPHTYFEENCLHAEIVAIEKDFDVAISKVQAFLPFIDNWAVCDTFNVKCFAKHKQELKSHILCWLEGEHVYTIRFGIVNSIRYFLDDFDCDLFEKIVSIKSDEYYVNMAIAWYISAALVKNYDYVVSCLKSGTLNSFVQNKSIQKVIESLRISKEQKDYLRTLKRE